LNKQKKYFFFSLFLHLTLFSASLLFLFESTGEKEFKPSHSLNTYVYSSLPQSPVLQAKGRHTTPQKKISQPALSSEQSQIKASTQASPLLKLLHNAIAESQQYPETAIALKQTGSVKIGFILYPNGHLTRISMLKSSGFETLDTAALQAVETLSPIKEANAYLKKEAFFSVDVVFG